MNIILMITHKLWNCEISRILCRAKETGIINSRQLHDLSAAFDPTQKAHCQVGRPDFYPWNSITRAEQKDGV